MSKEQGRKGIEMNEYSILLWKELRSQTYTVVCTAAVMLVSVCTALYLVTINSREDATFVDCFSAGLVFGAYLGLSVAQLILLCVGGLLIGGERILRTFEFLFTQPVSRTKIALAKLTFGILLLTMIWAIGGAFLFTGFFLREDLYYNGLSGLVIAEIAAAGLLLFSSAWLVSSRLDHPVLSIAIGFLVCLLVIGGIS